MMARADKVKTVDIRQKTEKELHLMLEEKEQELMNLRFQKAVSKLDKPVRLRELKKDKARILTILREKVKK